MRIEELFYLSYSDSENVLSPSESGMSSIASSPALSASDEIAPKQEIDHSREHIRAHPSFADITAKGPTKTSNKPADAWPTVKSKMHPSTTNAWSTDEEVLSTKTHKSTNAWPPVKSSMSSDTPGTSFNEDERKPYVSEGKSQCPDRILKLNELFIMSTDFLITYLNHCFQKRKMKVMHPARRRRKRK